MKYVEVAGNHLVLRPHNTVYPVEVVAIDPVRKAHDYLTEELCYVGIETRFSVSWAEKGGP